MTDETTAVFLELVRVGLKLTKATDELCAKVQGMNAVQWDRLMQLCDGQGMGGVVYDALCESLKGVRLSQEFVLPMVQSALVHERQYDKMHAAQQWVVTQLGKAGMTVMVLKGESVGRYYPKPNHRYSGDIDIYLGENYQKGNETLTQAGAEVSESFYRHSSIAYRGVHIENHCWLSDKGVERGKDFEMLLRELALPSLQGGRTGEPVYPSPDFNALFLSWHASAHFMFEKVNLRQVTDWLMFLLNEARDVDVEQYRKVKRRFAHGKFADILTAIVLRYLSPPTDSIPQAFLDDAAAIDTALVDKVFDHILYGGVVDRSHGALRLRWSLMKQAWRERWKYTEVYDMNYLTLMMHKIRTVVGGHE